MDCSLLKVFVNAPHFVLLVLLPPADARHVQLMERVHLVPVILLPGEDTPPQRHLLCVPS